MPVEMFAIVDVYVISEDFVKNLKFYFFILDSSRVCYYTGHYLVACRLVDGTSMNEECVAVDAVGSMPKLQPWVDRQVCAVRFLT